MEYWNWGNGFHDFGLILGTLFGGIWSIMSAQMPLIGLTYQQFFLGSIGVSVGLVILRLVGLIDGSVSRTSSTSYPKIAANRKDDEF